MNTYTPESSEKPLTLKEETVVLVLAFIAGSLVTAVFLANLPV